MIHQFFPTHIYQASLYNKGESRTGSRSQKKNTEVWLQELVRECYVYAESDDAGHEWCEQNNYFGYTSYGSLSRLDLCSSTFEDLEKMIRTHVASFIKNLEYQAQPSDLCLNSMWMNIMPQGCFHTSHIHPLSVLSGTFYLQVNEDSSAIKFEDPRLTNFMNQPLKKNNPRQSSPYHVEIKPRAGEVILFESWLRHEVPVHTDKTERISISFNYGWKDQGQDFGRTKTSNSKPEKRIRR